MYYFPAGCNAATMFLPGKEKQGWICLRSLPCVNGVCYRKWFPTYGWARSQPMTDDVTCVTSSLIGRDFAQKKTEENVPLWPFVHMAVQTVTLVVIYGSIPLVIRLVEVEPDYMEVPACAAECCYLRKCTKCNCQAKWLRLTPWLAIVEGRNGGNMSMLTHWGQEEMAVFLQTI